VRRIMAEDWRRFTRVCSRVGEGATSLPTGGASTRCPDYCAWAAVVEAGLRDLLARFPRIAGRGARPIVLSPILRQATGDVGEAAADLGNKLKANSWPAWHITGSMPL